MLALWKTPGRYDVLDEETVPELGGMIRAFQYLKMEDRRTSATDLEQFKSEYRRNRFQHQIKYFLRQAARSSAVDRRLSRVIRFCVYIGIALMFARGILSLLSPPASPGKLWITVLAALLFEVATIARALIVVYDIERRQARYRELSQNLKLWEQEFSALQTWPSVLRVSARIERTLLAELLEWRSLAKHTKLPRK
jgi:ABC-type multidrug transport system fused ATPase/permease subunit